ncbi:WD40 repeat domain-containing protein [Mycobacterium sp.]|uniref:WD40 repeat domain-containing protein n=1 Tax=Mycobacterium sp. TaxID=1785 RepID=UPI003BAE9108
MWLENLIRWGRQACTFVITFGVVSVVLVMGLMPGDDAPIGEQIAEAGCALGVLALVAVVVSASRAPQRPADSRPPGRRGHARIGAATASGPVRTAVVSTLGPRLMARRGIRVGNGVSSFCFGPDGRSVAIASSGLCTGVAVVFDTATGTVRWRYRELQLKVRPSLHAVAFSPTGHYVATGGSVSARLLDATSGRRLAKIAHHVGQAVRGVAFSPDGRQLVVCLVIG